MRLMALSNVSVGSKILASIVNLWIAAINAISSNVVTPTSVAGTGVSLSGANVVASTATGIAVNGCFTSAYTWYEIEFDLTTSADTTIAIVWRLSGTDATTAYDSQRVSSVNATSTTSQALNAASIALTGASTIGRTSGSIRVYQPAVAAATTGTVTAGASANPMTTTDANLYTAFFLHRTTTAYDGFTITPGSGNLTGTIKVKGIL